MSKLTKGPLVVISLGWGLQSWTLAAMSAIGVLPKVDIAIHADTTHERSHTYAFARENAPWLVKNGIPVVTITNNDQYKTDIIAKNAGGKDSIVIPAHVIGSGKGGMLRRQCTSRWKIYPIRRFLQKIRNGRTVYLWLGITTDEWHRAKDADVNYIVHKYPLLDMNMSREDCENWLKSNNLPIPQKSSCVFCPYLNRASWQEMKLNGGPDWHKAVEVDNMIRDFSYPDSVFLHRKCLPLDEAVQVSDGAGASSEIDNMDAECDSGHCFV